jgi:hypothetical protein
MPQGMKAMAHMDKSEYNFLLELFAVMEDSKMDLMFEVGGTEVSLSEYVFEELENAISPPTHLTLVPN